MGYIPPLGEPVYDHYSSEVWADGLTGWTASVDFYVDMASRRDCTLQSTIGGGGVATLKVYITTQDDGTAQDLCTYVDVSQYGVVPKNIPAALASYVATLLAKIDCSLKIKYIKLEYIVTGTVDLDVRTIKGY